MRGPVARVPVDFNPRLAGAAVALLASWPAVGRAAEAPDALEVSRRSGAAWYFEGGAFAEVNDDVNPAATSAGTPGQTAGLGVEVRLGRSLARWLGVDAGLRLGGNADDAASTVGVDFGLRLETGQFVSPYAGLRLGYTFVSGQFEDDWEPATAGRGETAGHALHLRPEVGVAVGNPRTIRVLAGVTANRALARRVSATYADGLPVPDGELARAAGGGDGLGGRLAVSVAF
jgi:hypothetical protein